MIDNAYLDALQIHLTSSYFITGIKGTNSMPPVRKEQYTRARRHGVINRTKYYDARVIEIKGAIVATSLADFQTRRDALATVLTPDSRLFRFQRSGSFPEQCYVEVDTEVTIPEDYVAAVQVWSCTLLADDPLIYSQTLNSNIYDPTTVGLGVGAPFPMVFPTVFSGTTTTGLLADVQGTVPTPPVLTVQGPVVGPIIDSDTLDASIYTTGLSMAFGDAFVVDVGARTATLNGTPRPDLIDSSSSTWFNLVNATENSLRLRGTGMVTGETSLQVQWRDARN